MAKVYAEISDQTAADHIKFVKLLAYLPPEIKENIKEYDKAIESDIFYSFHY